MSGGLKEVGAVCVLMLVLKDDRAGIISMNGFAFC